ncbi:sensor domain-containing diguanylate cyclase [Bowmanella dokdonensis]
MLVGFLLVAGIISLVAYYAISNMVGEQSRLQQQAMSPVFALIDQELMKPMYVGMALAKAGVFKPYLEQSEPDKTALLAYLQELQKEFGFGFFVASEKSGFHMESDGTDRPLLENSTEWYFELREKKMDFRAALGKTNDVHLFMDFRQLNEQGEFLGFVGVSKSLRDFLEVFSVYKQKHGYDFLFVNTNNEILLTSDPRVAPTGSAVTSLADLDWYPEWQQVSRQINSQSNLITRDGRDLLITEMPVNALNWRLFLISPLEARKQAITQTFIGNLVLMIASFLLLYFLVSRVSGHFQSTVSRRVNTDPLTGLSNRLHVEDRFQALLEARTPMSLILADIDHFKSVNDQYGHNVGDKVIRKVADLLVEGVRKVDTVGRWGGEEFIILLPDESLDSAVQVAERIRESIAAYDFRSDDWQLNISISLGVTRASQYESLADLIHAADKALYRAKNEGRNRVVASTE